MSDRLKIAYLNVRSMVPKLVGLKNIIYGNDIDILCVSETWLSTNIDDEAVRIGGFSFVRGDRGSRGGGVGIYIRNNLRYVVLNYSTTLEQLWIMIAAPQSKTVIGVAYRQPTMDYKYFLDELENSVMSSLQITDTVVYGGDFNINLLNTGSPAVDRFQTMVEALGGEQLIASPTRVTMSSSSLIDVIVTLDKDIVEQSGVISCSLSDHDIVFCTASIYAPPRAKFRTVRSFRDLEYAEFRSDLCRIPLQRVFYLDNIDDKLSFFNDSLISLFDLHAPLKRIRINRPAFPWITDNIRLLIKCRDAAKSKYRRTGNPVNWEYYKSLRNFTTLCIRNEKKAYFSYLERHVDSGGLWKGIGCLGIKNEKEVEIPPHLGDPNSLNNFFLNATRNMSSLHDTSAYENPLFDSNFEFQPVSCDTLMKYVLGIKSNAIGCDGLSITMLKFCCPYILPYFAHIVNSCIVEGRVPVIWKEAIVRPIPKINNPVDYSDLRAISILPASSKVFEKIIRDQISAYVNEYNILPNNQSGFRSGFSCTTALLKVTDDILGAVDKGMLTVLALLDFSRAFDTVDHGLLVSILKYIGFGGGSLRLMTGYMESRYQRVRVDDQLSDRRLITAGVPQGSILGPILFSIYTAFFVDKINYCTTHIYADDTQLYYSFLPSELDDAILKVNNDLECVRRVSCEHGLQLNPEKCKVLVFGSKTTRNNLISGICLRLDGQCLPIVDTAKNLGLWVDNTFRYRKQICNYIRGAYVSLRKIYLHRHDISQNLKKQLCEHFVLSKFNYCAPVYHPAIDIETANRIQKVQNSCLRLIYGIRKYHRISHKLAEARWLSMANRRQVHSLCLYHKVLLGGKPEYLFRKVVYGRDVHGLHLRYGNLISVPRHRTALFERSFSYHIYKSYNLIPEGFRSMSVKVFKKKVVQLTFEEQSEQIRNR